MLEYFLKAFAILFIAIAPIDNAAVYAALGHNYTRKELNRMALRAVLIAGIVLGLFSILGNYILTVVGIGLYSLQIGGGVLLMLLAVQIVMSEQASMDDMAKKHKHRDISVFPLAMPLIAGPAAITQMTLLMGGKDWDIKVSVLAAMFAIMFISYLLFRAAGWVTKLLGDNGAEMLSRILGILLAALAADLIIGGLRASGLFG